MRQGGTGDLTTSFDLAAAPCHLSFAANPADYTDATPGIVNPSILSRDLAG